MRVFTFLRVPSRCSTSGVTTGLELRIRQHKEGRFPGSFTSKYKVDKLVYLERYGLIVEAIAREKQLKGWLRRKKIALFVENNPTWCDLSLEWGQPIIAQEPGPPTTFG